MNKRDCSGLALGTKVILNVIGVAEIRSLFQQMTYKHISGGNTFITKATVL